MSDAWVPVALAVRHACVGDVFYSAKTSDLWLITGIQDRTDRPARSLSVSHAAETHTVELDLDKIIQVLVPVLERDALRVCRDELGAKLAERG